MFFALALVLFPFAVAQQIHDVQVGSTDGSTLAFSPEAIVRYSFTWILQDFVPNHYYRVPIPVIKSSSTCQSSIYYHKPYDTDILL